MMLPIVRAPAIGLEPTNYEPYGLVVVRQREVRQIVRQQLADYKKEGIWIRIDPEWYYLSESRAPEVLAVLVQNNVITCGEAFVLNYAGSQEALKNELRVRGFTVSRVKP